MQSICDLAGVEYTYRGRKRAALQLDRLSIYEGEFLGLLGPNGSGKTTTIKVITGQLNPQQGAVWLWEQPMPRQRAAVKAKIGLVPQQVALYEAMSVAENLSLFGRLFGLRGNALRRRIDAVLDEVQMREGLKRRISELSGGMKQRVNVAAALLHKPSLLILDEPTVGIDPQSRHTLFSALERLNQQGVTMLYTSHYLEEVESMCSRIVILHEGHVCAKGSLADLHAAYPEQRNLSEIFLRITSESAEALAERKVS